MSNYELLWECYQSEQMTFSQLEKHMIDDPEFRVWVMEKVSMQLYQGIVE